MAKMHPTAVDLALAVRTDYVQDARTHACQWDCTNENSALARLWVSQLVPVACSSVHKYCRKWLHICTKSQFCTVNSILVSLRLFF